MSIQEISPIGPPISLKYDQLPSIPESAKSYEVNVARTGLTIVTGSPVVTGDACFIAPATGPGLINKIFNSQNIDFNIPSGHSDNVFLDTRETTLSGRMTIVVTTASVGGTGVRMNLIGSFASFFDSLTLYSWNVPVESIYNYNILCNQLLNSNVNLSERYGSISISSGGDYDSPNGIDLPHVATGTYLFNFSIPLISIIGSNTAGTSNKLYPVGSVSNLMLRMTTSNQLPFATQTTIVTTTQPQFTVALDSFNLNMKYIDIGDIAGAMLRCSLYNGQYFIKSSTYTGSNATLPTGSFGVQSLSLQIRNSSVKSMFYRFGINKSAKCVNGYFDAVNPNLIGLQTNIGGIKYPNKPLNPSMEPATCFQTYLQAHGASGLKNISGIMTRSSYNATINTVTAADSSIVVPDACTRAKNALNAALPDSLVEFPNTAYYGSDCERVSGSLFSGINTRMAAPILDLNIATSLTETVTLYAFALSDCILKIDPSQKTLEVLL